ncbi:MAG: flagellar protein export ATPase FliI [Synergistetes bacterium]|nr:MAG: Flagellar protein export ATPase FliI [bacterium 42_11]MBC7331019.1 flagellar protein export ATPase FliI [Synergistota bacterium]MDK2871590.1 flagellum-specific synthase [bacterium]
MLSRYIHRLREFEPIKVNGKVTRVVGLVVESKGPEASIGELCEIRLKNGKVVKAEVVGFRDERVLLMPLEGMDYIYPGCEVIARGETLKVRVGDSLLGRVLNAFGEPIDGKGPIDWECEYPLKRKPPSPLARNRIKEPISVGIRAIDGLLTCGKGQRMGIFAGSGIGKSVLLGMIARNTSASVSVIGLIGERGREVREFIERDLGEEGLKRSVVVVATSDEPALIRLKAAFTATAIAEYFRDKGLDVMLMMDSVTRFAMAQREVGLTIGEPPATRGYTPSVFSVLPTLLERAGNSERGSITAFYTVLVEGDDMNEPIADTVRSILDGHIVLSRRLASQNHYPAIDILRSISRLMIEIVPDEHYKAATKFRELMAAYEEAQDLINIGAYVRGSNRMVDEALDKLDEIKRFLIQGINEKSTLQEAQEWLIKGFGG